MPDILLVGGNTLENQTDKTLTSVAFIVGRSTINKFTYILMSYNV